MITEEIKAAMVANIMSELKEKLTIRVETRIDYGWGIDYGNDDKSIAVMVELYLDDVMISKSSDTVRVV